MKFVSKIFAKHILTEVNDKVRDELIRIRKNQEMHRKENEIYLLSMHVGKFVISIPNEIENLSIIKITKIEFITLAQDPILVGFDIMRNKEVIIMGKVFTFTEQKFDAFNDMHPNSRIAIVYENCYEQDIDKSSTQKEELIDPVFWKETVFERMREFQ